jgi:hypothetical protein
MGALDGALKNTLKNIKEKIHAAYPTILRSGNGYHIYLPIGAFILELEGVFKDFEQPSRKFLRWAEQYLSNNKADPSHSITISFKNCMLRIPSSHNSKNVSKNNGIKDDSTKVEIIQKWNGYRPAINYLLRDFRRYLIQGEIDRRNKDKCRKKKHGSYNHDTENKMNWIEILLETPIEDYRKFAVWRILAPYLINVRKVTYNDAFDIIKDWLSKCDSVCRLDFSAGYKIKYDLHTAAKIGYYPIGFDKLKKENRGLHGLIMGEKLK